MSLKGAVDGWQNDCWQRLHSNSRRKTVKREQEKLQTEKQ